MPARLAPAVAGGAYTFSAWARLQPFYCGLDPSAGTRTFIKMEFLDTNGALIGAPVSVELGASNPAGPVWDPGLDNQGVWQKVSLPSSLAPAGTASIRVSAGATGMFSEGSGQSVQSAMFDDFSLIMAGSGGNLLAESVPEPSTLTMLFVGAVWTYSVRRRQLSC